MSYLSVLVSLLRNTSHYLVVFRQHPRRKQMQSMNMVYAGCFELIIYQEEQLFKDSLAAAAKIEKPIPPEGAMSPEMEAGYNEAMKVYEQQLKRLMMACVEAQMIPPGVKGLIPDGDVTMLWRWLGPVYEDSTQDILNNSIVVRNFQELGVDSIEALKYLFPSKTDEERAEMLSGFPFRMVNELQGCILSICSFSGGHDADSPPSGTGSSDGCRSQIGFDSISVSNSRSITKGDELCRTLPSNRPHR